MESRKTVGEYFSQANLENLKVQMIILRVLDENNVLREESSRKDNLDLFIRAQLFNNQTPILPQKYARLTKLLNKEDIIFNYNYRDLEYNAFIAITLWTTTKKYDEMTPLGSTIVSLFDQNLRLREGKHNLIVWPNTIPDTSNSSSTPGLVFEKNIQELNYSLIKQDELHKIMNAKTQDSTTNDKRSFLNLVKKIHYTYKKVPAAFIEIELPKFVYPVYFEERENLGRENFSYLPPAAKIVQTPIDFADVVTFADYDHDINRSDPVESHWYSILRDDENPKDLSPNKFEMEKIEKILKRPNFDEMKEDEKVLIWRFRYKLQGKSYALTKFLHSVKWHIQKEEEEAMAMLDDWAQIDSHDALHLLSAAFCANDFYNKKQTKKPINAILKIRSYAVKILRKEEDKNLFILILLQMVQALRYEKFEDNSGDCLSNFLIERVKNDITLSTLFFWYLSVECASTRPKNETKSLVAQNYERIRSFFLETLSEEKETQKILDSLMDQEKLREKLKDITEKVKRFDTNQRKKEELKKICSQKEFQKNEFAERPLCLNPNFIITSFEADECFVFKSAMAPLRMCFKGYEKESREKADIKKKIIFKSGDDLRQDQLVLQMINLMDTLLKRVNVECNLTPFQVLACSKNDGFMEFVPDSETLQELIKRHGNLNDYFLKLSEPKTELADELRNDEEKKKFVSSNFTKLQENFINSCAGYCVITYLLGVGDRHKENLMVNKEGKFWHLDFGFILGKDPKPYPPPFKLCSEMIEGIGGKNSEGYITFQKKCIGIYLYLRKYSRLILNLFQLMLDSGIKDISQEALDKMVDKFSLEENEENAEKNFLEIVDASARALFPFVTDKFHEWLDYWRK